MLPVLITTRLGVRFPGREPMAESAVRERFELLRRTSARSLAAIADLKPWWVIQTSELHAETVRTLFCSLSIPASVNLHIAVRPEAETTRWSHPNLPDRFLCLRLDSDDLLLRDRLVQALTGFTGCGVGTLVDFPRGFLFDMASQRIRRMSYPVQGPFYGIVTTPDNAIAAVGTHGKARAGRNCVEQFERSWVQTVHSGNDSTRFASRYSRAQFGAVRGRLRRARGTRPAWQIAAYPADYLPIPRRRADALRSLIAE